MMTMMLVPLILVAQLMAYSMTIYLVKIKMHVLLMIVILKPDVLTNLLCVMIIMSAPLILVMKNLDAALLTLLVMTKTHVHTTIVIEMKAVKQK
jgi:hypothetical protein